MPEPIQPTVGRQLRMGTADHDALLKAAERGDQNEYILTALRRQLRRDGYLTGKNGSRRQRRVKR